jgi:anti-anti-sigma factor
MPVKCDEYNGVCVLALNGDLTGEAGAHIKRLAGDRIDKRQMVDFVVDLQKAGFVDSAGLEALLWLKRRCDDLFGKVKLASLDEDCRKILEITRLAHRFECHADLSSALKTMR